MFRLPEGGHTGGGVSVPGDAAGPVSLSRRGFLKGMLAAGVGAMIVPASSLMKVRGPRIFSFGSGRVNGLEFSSLEIEIRADVHAEKELEWIDKALREVWDKWSITPTHIHVDRDWAMANGIMVPA